MVEYTKQRGRRYIYTSYLVYTNICLLIHTKINKCNAIVITKAQSTKFRQSLETGTSLQKKINGQSTALQIYVRDRESACKMQQREIQNIKLVQKSNTREYVIVKLKNSFKGYRKTGTYVGLFATFTTPFCIGNHVYISVINNKFHEQRKQPNKIH